MSLLDFFSRFKRTMDVNKPKRYTIRQGKRIEVDAVFDAWTSGDLDKMLAVVDVKTNPVDRGALLVNIVQETYKLRSNPEMRATCKRMSELHLAEFPDLAGPLKEETGSIPRVSTFQHYATVLTEDGEFAKAIDVCNQAIEYGLKDGTKSGFEGRISRIEKKRQKAQ